MTRCPHWNVCPFREMKAPTSEGVYDFEVPGIMGRMRRRFEQTVTSWPQTQPVVVQQPPEPQSNINTSELQPGETRESKRYRPKTIADIMPHLAYSAIVGGAVGGIVIGAGGTAKEVLGWTSGSFALLALVLAAPVVWVGKSNVETMTEKLTRVATPASEEGNITLPTKSRQGSSIHWRYPQIKTPRVGRKWLARWFWRIHRNDGVGFSQNVAQNYHIQRGECKGIQDTFVLESWAERRSDNSVDILPEGLDVMADVIREIYPTAHLSPEDA